MSRTAHLVIGLGIIVLCVLWCFVGVLMFWAAAVGKDSSGAGLDDPSFVKIYVIFGAGLLCGLWLAFRSFRRALRPPRLDAPPATTPMPSPARQEDGAATPNERLAHLVKKPER